MRGTKPQFHVIQGSTVRFGSKGRPVHAVHDQLRLWGNPSDTPVLRHEPWRAAVPAWDAHGNVCVHEPCVLPDYGEAFRQVREEEDTSRGNCRIRDWLPYFRIHLLA